MKLLTNVGDRVAQRIAVWLALAFLLTLACYYLHLRFSPQLTGDLLSARLALLGLIGAIATFQYGIWQATATRTYERINDPRWIQFEAELDRDRKQAATTGTPPQNVAERELALQAWRIWRDDNLDEMDAYILPHSRRTLTNYVASAYFLLISTAVDLVGLLVKTDTDLGAAVAAGMLVASLPPFIDVWWRYAKSLSAELGTWERVFREARKSGHPQ